MHQLTTPQRERLRRLVRRSPAFIGMRVEVHDDRIEVVRPEPVTLGFDSLSALVADTPVDRWPATVDGYLERALVLATSDPAELDGPTKGVLERIYQRLLSTDYEDVEFPSYAEEIVPGLLRVFAFDPPEAILTMNDDRVHRHGYDRLFDAGVDNLCRELPDQYADAGPRQLHPPPPLGPRSGAAGRGGDGPDRGRPVRREHARAQPAGVLALRRRQGGGIAPPGQSWQDGVNC